MILLSITFHPAKFNSFCEENTRMSLDLSGRRAPTQWAKVRTSLPLLAVRHSFRQSIGGGLETWSPVRGGRTVSNIISNDENTSRPFFVVNSDKRKSLERIV